MRIITSYQAAQAGLHQLTQYTLVSQRIQTGGCRIVDSQVIRCLGIRIWNITNMYHERYKNSTALMMLIGEC